MKAQSLLANSGFAPEELKVLYKAFDDAWEQISPGISQRAEAVEAARIKLAGIILGLASNRSLGGGVVSLRNMVPRMSGVVLS